MALKAADKEKLKKFGIDVEKLESAVKAEAEMDFEVPERIVLTQDELDTRDKNNKLEGKKDGEKEGEVKGKQLAAKALKTKFGIEDAEKDLDKVVDLVNTKVSTGDAGLREQNQLLIADKERLAKELETKETQIKEADFDRQLIGMFPANRSGDLKDEERLFLAKRDLTFDQVDGKTVVKRNGEIQRDSATKSPLPIDKVIGDYFAERKWVGNGGGAGGGRGGDDKILGGGAKKFSQVQSDWLTANPNGNVMSPEFQSHLEAIVKDNPDFDYEN